MESNKFTKMLAKAAYFGFVRPYRWLYNKIALSVYESRLKDAKAKAVAITSTTGKACYVVFRNGKFYTLNRGGMLAMAKAYRKKTGLSIDWRNLYVFKTEVKKP